MVQKKEESLCAYIDCFKAVASQVTIDDAASIEVLQRGLWYECHFRKTLASSKPSMLKDALHLATIYINIEDEREVLHKQHALKLHALTKVKLNEVYRKPRHHHNSYRDEKGLKIGATYQIGEENSPYVPWKGYIRPERVSRPEENSLAEGHSRSEIYIAIEGYCGEASSSYCDFHEKVGHSTSECRQLQDFLLNKYKKGEVPDAVHKPWQTEYRDYRSSRSNEQRRPN